jgi:hypothetical protein
MEGFLCEQQQQQQQQQQQKQRRAWKRSNAVADM